MSVNSSDSDSYGLQQIHSGFSRSSSEDEVVYNSGNEQYLQYMNEQQLVNEVITIHISIMSYITSDDHELEIHDPSRIVHLLRDILLLPLGSNSDDQDSHIVRPLQDQFEPIFDSIRSYVEQGQNPEPLWELICNLRYKYFEVIDNIKYDSSLNMTVRQWKEVWNEYLS